MTAIALPLLEDISEVEHYWPQIWPMMEDFQQHHAALLGGQLRPDRKERALNRLRRDTGSGHFWQQLAVEAGKVLGMASTHILEKGVTTPERAGYFGDAYMLPEARGRGLIGEMSIMREEHLRQQGISILERAMLPQNTRAVEMWGKFIWGGILKRPLRVALPEPDGSIRRIKDVTAEWPKIWPLLAATGSSDEESERQRLDALLESRGVIYVAGEGVPVGLIAGRLSINPWIMVERAGVIAELRIAQGTDSLVEDILLDRLEFWLATKRAESIQTWPMPIEAAEPWLGRGFLTYMYRTQTRI